MIVEIASLVTDDDLEPLDDGIDLIVHQPPEALAEMDDFVRKMHTKSGLLPEIEASTTSLADAGAQVARRTCAATCPSPAPRRCAATASASTAASSTATSPSSTTTCTTAASTCRRFKELCRRWYPDVYQKRPGKAETHRALDDIRESIAELRFYREHMLRPTPDGGTADAVTAAQPSSSRERAEERGHRALARRVAHEADAPALARELAEPAADLDAEAVEQLACAAWRRRRRRAATRW